MVEWLNFTVLLFSSLLFLVFYVRSVSPAGLEKIVGTSAYARCGRDRLIAGLFEVGITINYVVYYFYPLDTPLPPKFPWSWWFSALFAAVIGIPALILMLVGVRDAGEEAIRPRKEHTMYGGIYQKIRHPQAAGEVFLFLVIALLLNSPFLALFSLVYFPIFWIMCWAEEQDLLLRYGEAYAEYCRKVGRFFPLR